MMIPLHPLCERCGWRKGGVDSWDGKGCKCGHQSPPHSICTACNYAGTTHEGRLCHTCQGSGLGKP